MVQGALAKEKVHNGQAFQRDQGTDTVEKVHGILEGGVTSHDERLGQQNLDDGIHIGCEHALTMMLLRCNGPRS